MFSIRIIFLLLTIIILTSTSSTSLPAECDDYGIMLYEDMGCHPVGGNETSCPKKYECLGLKKSKNHCYFRGKAYTDGEKVDEEISNPSCDKACFCDTTNYSGEGKFICAILDCPEWLGRRLEPGCYRKHSLGKCCASGQVCPPFNGVRCKVDGHEYKEGEKFYPKDTCYACVCQAGFTAGKFEEPFCRRRICGVQLKQFSAEHLRDRCAPIYSDKVKCCPHNWICPDGSEVIEGEVSSDFGTCLYGDQSLKIGQHFIRRNIDTNIGPKIEKVKCECLIPPLLTCTTM